MCGISGIVARDPDRAIPVGWIRNMMASQAHRGPDDSHVVAFPGCVLGFNRLSVLDLSVNGRQPMSVDSSPCSIVFNGEIYNYKELASRHRGRGITFQSRSDTEVLLHSYVESGEGCLGDLNGMWAFAIYDPARSSLFAARDRFGVKPFYYYADDQLFAFASEIKALLQLPFVPREPDLGTLFPAVFERANDRSSRTCFRGVRQLPPSHFLTLDRAAWGVRERRYWSIRPPEPRIETTRDGPMQKETAREFLHLLQSAVEIRLRSDRPMGLLLSGGLDSSSIAAALADLRDGKNAGMSGGLPRVFTMALPGEDMDESRVAQETARKLGLPCHLIEATRPDFDRLVPAALWHNDEPLPLLNRCVHWRMMEEIGRQGVIVILNGQGGDETTGGYFDRLVGSTLSMALRQAGASFKVEWQQARALCGFRPAWLLGQLLKTHMSQRWVRSLRALTRERAVRLATFRFLEAGILRDAGARLVKGDRVNDQLMRWLTRDTVPDLCHYEDRNAAAHGLEQRFPYLDYRLVEFMFRLPWTCKTWHGASKALVREAQRGRLPESVVGSHRKIGLGVPEDKWIRGPLAPLVQDLAASRAFRERGIWRAGPVRDLIRRHVSGTIDAGNLIWRIVGTELWFRMFLDRAELAGASPGIRQPVAHA